MAEKSQKSKVKSQNEGIDSIVEEQEVIDETPVEAAEENFADEIAAEAPTEVVDEPTEEVKEEKEEVKKVAHRKKREATKRVQPLHGKKYRKAVEEIDRNASYPKDEAIVLVKKTSVVKFDATVEVHIKVNVPNTRGMVNLPAGTGKTRKIEAVTNENVDAVLKKIEEGKIDFDILIAHPEAMPKLSKVARVLGPRGLMPNPKTGTVTPDIEKAKEEFSGGRVEYKQDKGNVIHMGIGKVSMEDDALKQNLNALLHALPSGKITSVVLSSTMGPGIRVSL